MPLPVAHGLVGASIVAAFHPRAVSERDWKPFFWGAFLAISPDFDFFFEWFLHWINAHRTFTHSLVFALAVGVLLFAGLGKGRRREAMVYSLAFLSHTLLDFVTTKITQGVHLLWPFSNENYKLGLWSFLEFKDGLGSLDVFFARLPELLVNGLKELLLFLPLFLLVFMIRQRQGYRAKQVVMQEQEVL